VQVLGNSRTLCYAFLEAGTHLPERWPQTKEIGVSIRKRQSIEPHDISSFFASEGDFLRSPAWDRAQHEAVKSPLFELCIREHG
jgi:hypothetical protein